jgi:hypothetical protein
MAKAEKATERQNATILCEPDYMTRVAADLGVRPETPRKHLGDVAIPLGCRSPNGLRTALLARAIQRAAVSRVIKDFVIARGGKSVINLSFRADFEASQKQIPETVQRHFAFAEAKALTTPRATAAASSTTRCRACSTGRSRPAIS